MSDVKRVQQKIKAGISVKDMTTKTLINQLMEQISPILLENGTNVELNTPTTFPILTFINALELLRHVHMTAFNTAINMTRREIPEAQGMIIMELLNAVKLMPDQLQMQLELVSKLKGEIDEKTKH